MDIISLGINKGKVAQFNKKNIHTIEDLVEFLPRKYFDFRFPKPIRSVEDGEYCSVVGTIIDATIKPNYIRVKVKDESNYTISVVWFNQNYVEKLIQVGKEFIFCGKIEIDEKYRSIQMLNPMYFSQEVDKYKKIIPLYSKIQGMSDDYLHRSIDTALTLVDKNEYLHAELLDRYSMIDRRRTIRGIHQPETMEDVEAAKERLLFDDLFKFAGLLSMKNMDNQSMTDIVFSQAETIAPFLRTLPFTLTEDQLSTVRSIFKDAREGKRVNALVQGDVGSGKTIVAFLLMLIAAENGYQSVLMAPTNVLASQHYEELRKIAESLGYNAAFLTGATKVREKKQIIKGLASGEIHFAIGTHALLSSDIEFNNLGLTIVDEEHRFGVVQRELLNEKTNGKVHNITMSATPIPRSLAITVYGDGVSVYNILQMPNGRKPILTELHKNDSVAYQKMYDEIRKGRQCYVVCPLIDESDADVMQGVLSVNEVYTKMLGYFSSKNVSISVITGNMKKDEIQDKLDDFSSGKTDILVSTTIIEVGVNVPNSTVIMIQNAERFGLAQLHQLRGRVGRGQYQSYCLLVSQMEENEKLNAMVETTNGFKIAEVDLKLRGAGDFIGTKQSGDNKYIMLMLSNPKLFSEIRNEIKVILQNEELRMHYAGFFQSLQDSLKENAEQT